MTADEFIAWSLDQTEGAHYELLGGQVYSMAPERMAHNLTKAEVYVRLRDAVSKAGLNCQVLTDGMTVRVDAETVYEPDAAVRCGDRLAGDRISYDDPVIVVEIPSPASEAIDSTAKLIDYFRLISVRHYLVVRTDRPVLVHHERSADGQIQTRILASGELRLNPPGIVLDVASLFPPQ